MFTKKENETINEYIHRIGLHRFEYGLTWSDIADLIEQEFNTELTDNAVRKRYNRTLNNNEYQTSTEEIQQKIEDKTYLYRIQKEKQDLNNFYKLLSREETIKEIGIDSAKLIAKNYSFNIKINKNSCLPTENDAILLIGDWHYGMRIDSIFNLYNKEIAQERVNKLANKVIEKVSANNVDTLYVINLGDMISGIIHLPLRLQSQTDVITQIIEVSELISNLLYVLSGYVRIEFYSTLDNHSRINPNKKESIQLETLARIIPWFLKERFKENSDIIIHNNNQYAPDIVSFNVKGFNILAVHGDKDKPNQVIDSLNSFTGKHHDLICLAHYHHFNCNEQNRTMLISNGSLMGTDEYATDLRLSSNPSQTMVVIGKNQVCEAIYKIDLS